jgi:tRNA-2-methylthio-N6-dimethylallyladenosine synthase
MARIYFETYGCQMNEADSRFIAERAVEDGYRVVEQPHAANVLVLNTCTVRDSAEQRAYGRLSSFKALKDVNPGLRIVVCGCLAEQDRDRMLHRMPFVDALFGTHELQAMAERIGTWAEEFEEEELVPARDLLVPLGANADGNVDTFTHLRAFVNVQYGCSYYCTYCIVPHVRGRFEHRPLAEILLETERRIADGAREITLVGQTVNAYTDRDEGLDFAGLLRRVAAVPGLDKLGFITSHPNDLNDELIAAFTQISQLNTRFHLALQSGSNPILKRMNRKYTIEAYLERITAFRKHCPDWALSTDIITGFPGETEDDFQKTLEIVEQLQFSQVYSFAYSPRRGTPAARWEQVDPAVSQERLMRLFERVNHSVQAYHERKIGSRLRVLVQGPSRKDPTKLAAKTSDNVTVIVSITGDAERFAKTPWLDVVIERAHKWGCHGLLESVAERYDGAAMPIPEPITLKPLINLLAR